MQIDQSIDWLCVCVCVCVCAAGKTGSQRGYAGIHATGKKRRSRRNLALILISLSGFVISFSPTAQSALQRRALSYKTGRSGWNGAKPLGYSMDALAVAATCPSSQKFITSFFVFFFLLLDVL